MYFQFRGEDVRFCIYLKQTEPEVSFSSEEHIFPAGIGGIKKLPLDFVSHDCNNSFSALELKFMRNSLISISRQFYGPGKRGKLNPRNASKSTVCLMTDVNDQNSIGLGYVSLGQPYKIFQVLINKSGVCRFKTDRSHGEINEQLEIFMESLKKYDGKYVLYEDERFSEDEFILGYHEGKWYVALSNKDFEGKIIGFVNMLKHQNPLKDQPPQYKTVQKEVMQKLTFDDSHFRICAKIIFNYLAFAKGQDFVLNSCFDELRDWIVEGGENKFALLIGEKLRLPISLPEFAHKLVVIQDGKSLRGCISFYDEAFTTQVNLCDNYEGVFEMDGFICDWKNKREYIMSDYIIQMAKKMHDELS